MASIIQIGEKYRAQVRRAGHPVMTKTHATREAAEAWANAIETDAVNGKKTGAYGLRGITFDAAVTRYMKENTTISKTAVATLVHLRDCLGKKLVENLEVEDIVKYIKDKEFSPASGAVHFSFFSSVLKMSADGWGYYVPEIVSVSQRRLTILKLIGKSSERERRPTPEEIARLLAHEWKSKMPMRDIIIFAMATAMRQAEIFRLDHDTTNLDGGKPTTLITDRKHPTKKFGNHQTVPLLSEAVEVVKRQSGREGRIFPYLPATVGKVFHDGCEALGIEDLHFHDLRHEGISRLFEMGYKIEEVAVFSGHLDWKMLQRYTHLKADNIRRLDGNEGKKSRAVPLFSADELEEMKRQVKEEIKREMMASMLVA